MKALILFISFLMLAATAAACLDLTPYPLVEVPEESSPCDGDSGDPASCADASDEGTAGDGGDLHE